MISIIEIIRQMKQGLTKPFLAVANNDKKYIIKGIGATYEGLVGEWVAGHLGVAFGLPIPDFSLAYVDDALIEFDKNLQSELGKGMVFGSEYCDTLQEITYTDLVSFDQSLLTELFVFDYWIKNDDRNLSENGGNPNLFIKQQTSDLVVLDHNMAFDKEFNLDSFKLYHVGANARGYNHDLFLKNEYFKKIDNAFQSLDQIIKEIPVDWLEHIPSSDDFMAQIKVLLQSYQSNSFWEAIK